MATFVAIGLTVHPENLITVAITLGACVTVYVVLPLAMHLRRRIRLADGQLSYQGWIRKRTFPVAAVAGLDELSGPGANDRKLVLVDDSGDELVSLRLLFWPTNTRDLIASAGVVLRPHP